MWSSDRSGGEILVDALRANNVDTVYCVPGESYLAVLDALYDAPQIRVITCRHEASAATMAEAHGKLTGRPGICFVTRGPGATHASTGAHTAMQDSTPMILFVGQVSRRARGREAFQEIDYAQMFGSIAKWATEVDDARRLPEFVSRAFRTAMSGRPGPVVLALPEDMLRDRVIVQDAPVAAPVSAVPGADQLSAMRKMLAAAERPVLVLGGSGWDAESCRAMIRFSERNVLATACSFRRQSLFDNRHANYIGELGVSMDPALASRIRAADLIIAVGGRLGGIPTNDYTLIEAPRPLQRLVHVHADPEELGRVYAPDLAINASPASFALMLGGIAGIPDPPWRAWTMAARLDYERDLRPAGTTADLDLAEVVRYVSDSLPDDAIVCNGAGNYAGWVQRYFQYRRYGTQLAPTSGAMGYGIPAAIAAKLLYPERIVMAFAGDGCFLMSGHELATATQYRAAIIVVVVNNGMYGTIRMHQERRYPGRVIASDLANPDFPQLARAYGALGVRITSTEEFPSAFNAALASEKPALIELCVDPELITTRTTLSAIRAKGLPPPQVVAP